MNIPMVVALNMMDEVIGNQGSIDGNEMEALLGVPVIPISAAKNEGVSELVEHAIHVAKYQERPLRQDFCDKNEKPKESKERIRSEKIDKVLTGKYTAIPCFIGIMVLVFYLTFNVVGAWLQGLLELGIDKISEIVDSAMTVAHVNSAIHSLVIDGIFTGVGSVLSFLPIIVTLFSF